MKQTNAQEESHSEQKSFCERLNRRRRRFKAAYLGGIDVISLSGWGVSRRMGGPNVCTDPLLKGAPQFIVLSLVVVFAAYLRQLSSGAVELRNKIVGGEIWNYPPDRGYSFVQKKVEALDQTADTLSVVGPLLIWLAVFATIRIGFDAVSKFVSPWSWIPSLLVWFDFGIAIWLFCTFACLGGFHFAARREEDKIRCAADEKEPEILKRLREKKEAAPEQRKRPVSAQVRAEPPFSQPPGRRAWSSMLLLFGTVLWLASRQTKT